MSPTATATGSCSSSLPLELVPIFLVVAVTVAEAVEKLDSKLFNGPEASLLPVRARSCNGRCSSRSVCSLRYAPPTTLWPSSSAVPSTRRLRAVQMACHSGTGPLIHWWFVWCPSG